MPHDQGRGAERKKTDWTPLKNRRWPLQGSGRVILILGRKQRRVEQKRGGQQTRLGHGRGAGGHRHVERVRAHEFGAEAGPHLGDLADVRQLGVLARVNVDWDEGNSRVGHDLIENVVSSAGTFFGNSQSAPEPYSGHGTSCSRCNPPSNSPYTCRRNTRAA